MYFIFKARKCKCFRSRCDCSLFKNGLCEIHEHRCIVDTNIYIENTVCTFFKYLMMNFYDPYGNSVVLYVYISIVKVDTCCKHIFTLCMCCNHFLIKNSGVYNL